MRKINKSKINPKEGQYFDDLSPETWFEIWLNIKRAVNVYRRESVTPVNLREECPELFIYSAN